MTNEQPGTVSLLLAADAQRPLVANLIQLYLHDMTEFMPFPVGQDGLFAYDFLDRFWRFPYLIMSGADIAGFALVIDECPLTGQQPCFFMAEFFILKAYRRQGVGKASLGQLLAHHAGLWHIGVPEENTAASKFWTHALVPFSPQNRPVQFEGSRWHLHELNTNCLRGE